VIYEAIGRAVVKFSSRYLRIKYKRQLRIGAGVAAVAVVAVVVRAARHVPEG
jgi:hypothetical protein